MRHILALCLAFTAGDQLIAQPEPNAVRAAVERGIQYLKSQHSDKSPVGSDQGLGGISLAGLALMESGVSPKDPIIVALAEKIRDQSYPETQTYHVALALMFLDRLGDSQDTPLIQILGLRLMGGVTRDGGWGYNTWNGASDPELRRMRQALQPELRNNSDPTKAEVSKPKPESAPPALTEEARNQFRIVVEIRKKGGSGGGDDNSNTQFALLGLWAARRHGVPVGETLGIAEARFRQSQQSDGGWGYHFKAGSTPSMTCVGLMGLAYAHGMRGMLLKAGGADAQRVARAKMPDPDKDQAIRAGLLYLARAMTGEQKPAELKGKKFRRGDLHANLYFLWSLERVAVAYGLTTIGEIDWYSWGADFLLQDQNRNGSWSGKYGGVVDTSFALLFLRKSNLTNDLSSVLRGKVGDPAAATLRAGGVGGETPLVVNSPLPEAQNSVGPGTPTVRPNVEPTAQSYAASLVAASPAERARLIEQYRDSRGAVYSDALALAAQKLDGKARTEVRDALADRLSRMTPATLRDKLKETHSEIRRAAVLACAMKEDRTMIPDIISVITDEQESVWRAARAALKALTNQDFGPKEASERKPAQAAWREWWQKQGGK